MFKLFPSTIKAVQIISEWKYSKNQKQVIGQDKFSMKVNVQTQKLILIK